MTQAREIHPGVTYHVTHTTVGRQFLLRPDAVVNQVMLFCLFYAAKECDVLVHSVMVESNHFHAVITDERILSRVAVRKQLVAGAADNRE
jgi:putative transposase